METKKYVRIIRNFSKYGDMTGHIFPLLGTWEDSYKIDGSDGVVYVRKKDVEVIVTENRRPKVDERVLITYGITSSGDYKTGDICTVRSVVDIYGVITVKEHGNYVIAREYEVIVNNEVENEEADGMESVNQTAIDTASTVFEKVGEDYIGSKSRLGDILIGALYSEAFVKAYASERKDVLVIPQTIEYTAFLRSDEMKEVAKKSEYPNSENDDYPYGITDEDIQEAIKEARRDRD